MFGVLKWQSLNTRDKINHKHKTRNVNIYFNNKYRTNQIVRNLTYQSLSSIFRIFPDSYFDKYVDISNSTSQKNYLNQNLFSALDIRLIMIISVYSNNKMFYRNKNLIVEFKRIIMSKLFIKKKRILNRLKSSVK